MCLGLRVELVVLCLCPTVRKPYREGGILLCQGHLRILWFLRLLLSSRVRPEVQQDFVLGDLPRQPLDGWQSFAGPLLDVVSLCMTTTRSPHTGIGKNMGILCALLEAARPVSLIRHVEMMDRQGCSE
jgi:hypothetical protein